MVTLYKKNTSGKLQRWICWANEDKVSVEFGLLDGKKQTTFDLIKEGKNIGKKNETSTFQQAIKEVLAKIEKKKKEGWVNSQKKASAGETDEVIDNKSWKPMLAKKFTEDGQKIIFPCAIQPKLDGIRACTSDLQLFSRTRKIIETVPHINEMLRHMNNLKLDGELYNHDYKDNFEKIVSIVKRKELHENHRVVQYHVYDINVDKPFFERMTILEFYAIVLDDKSPIRIVETKIVNDDTQMNIEYEQYLEQGYEGAMVRNLNSPYEEKRSNHLQKLKLFQDAEFRVIDVIEGKGKLMGHVGSFVCQMAASVFHDLPKRTFKVKAEGKQEFLQQCWNRPYLWKNKMLTVRFQNYSCKNNVPRFPVGVRFRAMEY